MKQQNKKRSSFWFSLSISASVIICIMVVVLVLPSQVTSVSADQTTPTPEILPTTGSRLIGNESVNTREGSIDQSGATQPNLVPFTPSGWDYPIVPSSTTGTNTVNTLDAASSTYIDWAVINTGTITSTTFYSCLYYDNSSMACWYTNGLDQNYYAYVTDWAMNLTPTAGAHTLKLVADVYNDVAEANESDNTWEHSFTWGTSGNSCYSLSANLGENKTRADNFEHPSPTALRASTNIPEAVELMPPAPSLIAQLEAQGYSSADIYTLTASQPAGVDQPQTIYTSVTGTKKALVLIVAFPDVKLNQVSQTSFYNNLLFSDGTYTSPGSMRDFYQANSYNLFDVQGTVAGCVLAPENSTYYAKNDGTHNKGFGPYPQNAQGLVVNTVNAADPSINFADYAVNGKVGGLFIIHAGRGAETNYPSDLIWSHSWDLSDTSTGSPGPVTVDGVQVDAYTMEPEYIFNPGDSTIGVFAHEYGHYLGLPDLYDTSYNSNGIGNWSLMSGGSWNGNYGSSPANLDAWSKVELGWITPTVITYNQTGITIPPVNSSATVYKLWTNGAPQNEYFLLENRQLSGFDAALPGAGLLIWHIDDSKSSNTSACKQLNNWLCGANHFWVALEQADGLFNLEKSNNGGDVGDPFPGSTTNRNFTFTSSPNSSSYYSSGNTYVGVTNITGSGSNIVADINVTLANYILSVSKNGTGSGTVISSPTGINCGSTCSYTFGYNVPVTLTAAPTSRSAFGGWSGGGCSGTGTCIVTLTASTSVTANFTRKVRDDYDGDGKTDPAKFISSAGSVWWLKSSTGLWDGKWLGSDTFTYVGASDFDGDGKTDPAKFYSASGTVWWVKSSTGTLDGQWLGPDLFTYITGSDFDGDGRSDPAKFYPATGTVWWVKSTTGILDGQWLGGDSFQYVSGSDFDGDGKTDPAKFYPATGTVWWVKSTTGTIDGMWLGPDTFTYVPASDFDGDGKTDPAKFYPATGTVWWVKSTTGTLDGAWLGPGTFTYVAGCDFDGDGKTDPTKYDASTHILSWLKSTTGLWSSVDLGAGTYTLAIGQ